MDREISIAKDFSPTPGPRYMNEGPYSAEAFRNEHFDPAFEVVKDSGGILTVNLDGGLGFGTSFLEEIFGGAVRKWTYELVKKHVRIISKQEPYLVDDINLYMDAANQ